VRVARGLSHEKRSPGRPIVSGISVAPLCGMGLLFFLGSVFAILLVAETIDPAHVIQTFARLFAG